MTKKNNKTKKGMGARARQRAQEAESLGKGWMKVDEDQEWFKPKKGYNTFDIVPYNVTWEDHPEMEVGEQWYQKTVWVHYGIGIDDKSYVCPNKTFNKKCPICEHMTLLIKEDAEENEKEIKNLKPSQRELFNVLHKGEMMLFTLSYHNFGRMLEEEIRESDEEDGYENFAEADESGFTLKARFKKKKFAGNEFMDVTRIDFNDRKKPLSKKILKKAVDLDAIINCLSYDDLNKIYWGDVSTDEEEETKNKGKNKKSKKAKEKKKSKKPKCFGDENVFDEDEEDCEDCPFAEKCESKIDDQDEEDDQDDDDQEDEDDQDDDDQDDDDDQEDDQDDDDDQEDDTCPYDHDFAVDCNETDDCEDCENWDTCQDACDDLEKKTKKKGKKKGKKKKSK